MVILSKITSITKSFNKGMVIMVIREAKSTDLTGVAKVKIKTWRSTYKGLISEDILENLQIEEQAEKFGDLLSDEKTKFLIVAEDKDNNNEIIGFAAGGCQRDIEYQIDGEVFAVYILDEYQNKGLGKKLMDYSINKLKGMGLKSMLVWVLDENPYKRFYEKIGGKEGNKKTIEIGAGKNTVVSYLWEKI